jgi:hypothetical protein
MEVGREVDLLLNSFLYRYRTTELLLVCAENGTACNSPEDAVVQSV